MKSVLAANCQNGDIIAEDVICDNGVVLISKDTLINNYIKSKILCHHINNVKIYESVSDRNAYYKFEKQYKEYIEQTRKVLRSFALGNYAEIKEFFPYMTNQIYQHISDADYVVLCLNSLHNKDEYTYTHCLDTAFYSMLIGNWLKLSNTQIYELITAALLHDIGKTKISPDVLNKKGKLDKEEFDLIKKHTVLGYEVIERMPELSADIKKGVLLHHERMDGSGYPYGLRANSIPLYAKIIAIADVFDAMTQNRVYKKKVSPFDSFEMFLTEGLCQFDYKILNTFVSHIAPLYVGNKVQLSNGYVGEIVFIPPQNITSPILFTNSEYLDLSTSREIKILQVV